MNVQCTVIRGHLSSTEMLRCSVILGILLINVVIGSGKYQNRFRSCLRTKAVRMH